mgnify:CR=1 FL=1
MATSSITDTVIITDPKQAEAFADAVEEASKAPLEYPQKSLWFVTDKEEIRRLMKRRKELHG